MNADEARKLMPKDGPIKDSKIFLVSVGAIENRIQDAARAGKTSIGMDWEAYREVKGLTKALFEHFEEQGFRVCGADDASYIGWNVCTL
jgi:hypothetical protein